MKNSINRQLRELLASGRLAEIYDNGNTDSFTVGRVIDFDEEYFLIQSFQKTGENDGLTLIEIDNLDMIVAGGCYTEKIKSLNEWRGGEEFPVIKNTGNLLFSVLEASLVNKEVIAAWVNGMKDFDLTGTVADIDKEQGIVTLLSLNKYGEYDGTYTFDTDDIYALDYADIECQSRKYLRSLIK